MDFELINTVKDIVPHRRTPLDGHSLTQFGMWLVHAGTLNGNPFDEELERELLAAEYERVAQAWIDAGVLREAERIVFVAELAQRLDIDD